MYVNYKVNSFNKYCHIFNECLLLSSYTQNGLISGAPISPAAFPPIIPGSFIICIWILVSILCCSANISKLMGIMYMNATTINIIITFNRHTAGAEPEKLLGEGADDVRPVVHVVDPSVHFIVFVVRDQFRNALCFLLLFRTNKLS